MNILFLCTSNVNRSKTAEVHFAAQEPLVNFRSAGLSQNECQRNGTTLCTEALLAWADVIFVMEAEHIRRIEQHTGTQYLDKILNLDIADIYQYGSRELIEQLEARREAMQFDELFARIGSPSSQAAALRLFQTSGAELAKTFQPDGRHDAHTTATAPHRPPPGSKHAQESSDKSSQ